MAKLTRNEAYETINRMPRGFELLSQLRDVCNELRYNYDDYIEKEDLDRLEYFSDVASWRIEHQVDMATTRAINTIGVLNPPKRKFKRVV